MSERVGAFDPGGRSGWAEATMDVDRLELGESGVLPMKDMGLWVAHQQAVVYMTLTTRWETGPRRWDVMVTESWRAQPKPEVGMEWLRGSNLLYAQHWGQIRLVAMLSGAENVTQEPKDKYNPATHTVPPAAYPAALQAIDDAAVEQHDQDARYHLWVYFFRNWFTGKVEPDACIV